MTLSPTIKTSGPTFMVSVDTHEWTEYQDLAKAARFVAHNILSNVGGPVQVEFRGTEDVSETRTKFSALIFQSLHELGYIGDFTTESNGAFSGYWIED